MKRHTELGILSALCLVFLVISFWNLDRFPEVHNDEAGIIEPGYNLFSHGVFGSRMYTGANGREQIYLEVMPLMPLLLGLSVKLFGVGVFQMRIVPVLAGVLVLVFTFQITREVSGSNRMSVLAALILLFWQLNPAGVNPFLGSGIPLIDISRIARYDILTSAFGLGAFWMWLRKLRTGQRSDAVGCGIFIGLALLTHLNGLIWLGIVGILDVLEVRQKRSGLKSVALTYFVAGLVLLPWMIVILMHWELFVQQFILRHQARAEFLTPSFYWNNLISEVHRYHLGLRVPGTYFRAGFWLFVLGLPLVFGKLWITIQRGQELTFKRLLIPGLIFPLFLALFEKEKRVYYLMLYLPLFAIPLAWGIGQLRPRVRHVIVAVIILQGLIGIGQMQAEANQRVSAAHFFSTLREATPPDGVVIGPQTFWFAFADREYRSIIAPGIIAFASPEKFATPFDALEWLRPNTILHHPVWETWYTAENAPGQDTNPVEQFLTEHHAVLLNEIKDPLGLPVRIFALEW